MRLHLARWNGILSLVTHAAAAGRHFSPNRSFSLHAKNNQKQQLIPPKKRDIISDSSFPTKKTKREKNTKNHHLKHQLRCSKKCWGFPPQLLSFYFPKGASWSWCPTARCSGGAWAFECRSPFWVVGVGVGVGHGVGLGFEVRFGVFFFVVEILEE